ncbi:hypothetical protein [Paludisphaera mucosa]|uniref:HEAT repeat domain-containing protein n=1 Tax=Paludisphaera mucosa TaxID=3030827 RepID=A0ABT6FI43_9BACT|nr:hypothetical protein [Paludisphaera mucosa]MDG3007048.1 hypothetical protein [Paludisphaera mucosa]
MLEDLDRVDWARLTHAYGPAGDLPAKIRGLASPDPKARESSRNGLFATIFHQGTRYRASAPAVPFLFEVLEAPETPERDQLIDLLVHLAVGYPEGHLPAGFDPSRAFPEIDELGAEDDLDAVRSAEPSEEDEYEAGRGALWARDAYRAVLARLDVFRRVADDDDEKVRKAAVRALAWFPEAAAESAALVRRIARDRPEPGETADAVSCLGILDRSLSDRSDVPWLQDRLAPETPFVVRVAAAHSLALILGKALPPEALDVLLDAITDPRGGEAEGRDAAWHMAGLVAQICGVIDLLDLEPTEPVVAALCKATEAATMWPSMSLWDTLLNRVFPDGQMVRFVPDPSVAAGQRPAFRDPREFTAVQRRAVEAVIRSPYWTPTPNGFGALEEILWGHALPNSREKLQALLDEA